MYIYPTYYAFNLSWVQSPALHGTVYSAMSTLNRHRYKPPLLVSIYWTWLFRLLMRGSWFVSIYRIVVSPPTRSRGSRSAETEGHILLIFATDLSLCKLLYRREYLALRRKCYLLWVELSSSRVVYHQRRWDESQGKRNCMIRGPCLFDPPIVYLLLTKWWYTLFGIYIVLLWIASPTVSRTGTPHSRLTSSWF